MKLNYANSHYVSFIKNGLSQVMSFGNSINLKIGKLVSQNNLKIHIKQDHENFDKIEISSFINGGIINPSSSGTNYTIEVISKEDWQVVGSIIKESTGSKNFHSTSFLLSELPFDFDGENTIRVSATTKRFSKTFVNVALFNYIGIYDSHLRNKKKINFIQITKKDE
jgi:hypothetical protein